MQPRAAAARQGVATRLPGMLVRDAVGECVAQHVAEHVGRDVRGRARIRARAAAPLRGASIDGRQRRARHRGVDPVRAECGQRRPAVQQRVAACVQPAHRIARLDQRGEIAGQRAFERIRAGEQHRAQTRMRAEPEHALPALGDPALLQGAEQRQQVARSRQCACGRRVEEAHRVVAPRGEFECEAGKVGLGDFGPALRFQPLRLRPQPVCPAVGHAPGASRALVGGGLADRDHIEPRKPGIRIHPRLTRETTVDDHAHAGQGDAGLGDIGRQHHAPLPVGMRREHAGLLLDGQFAVQLQDVDPCSRPRRVE